MLLLFALVQGLRNEVSVVACQNTSYNISMNYYRWICLNISEKQNHRSKCGNPFFSYAHCPILVKDLRTNMESEYQS